MEYKNGFVQLEQREVELLTSVTWSDKVENRYEAREFIQNMARNKLWAESEVKKFELNEQGEREKIIVETLHLAIQNFERFEQMAHQVAQSAGVSVGLH